MFILCVALGYGSSEANNRVIRGGIGRTKHSKDTILSPARRDSWHRCSHCCQFPSSLLPVNFIGDVKLWKDDAKFVLSIYIDYLAVLNSILQLLSSQKPPQILRN